jgi:serine O-acetyltransferase
VSSAGEPAQASAYPDPDPSASFPSGAAAAVPAASVQELLSIMREDWLTHGRELSRPGLHALLLYRYAAWRLTLRPGVRRKALSAVRHALWPFIRNVYGIEVHETAKIGRRVMIAHQGAVVIDGGAEIGDGCLIQHNVTIGRAQEGGGAPRIGRDVVIGSGALIAGDITVGDRARIGPNAVVLVDVPADTAVFAPPARQIPPKAKGDQRQRSDGTTRDG